jgi:hypothetical protein
LRRSACSKLERNSTASSRTLSVAVYVTLMAAQNPYEVDLWLNQLSYRGSASIRCTTTASAFRNPSHRGWLPTVTCR